MNQRELFEQYALAQLGIAYKYGGNNPLEGFDCSGLVQWLLKPWRMDPPGRQNAQMLHDHFKKMGCIQNVRSLGAIAFYGESLSDISHVALVLNEMQIIEAGGGDKLTLTREIAAARGACVRLSAIEHRSDLLITLRPQYPFDPGAAINLRAVQQSA